MDLNKLTKVISFKITKDGFIFYDARGSIPDSKKAYWDDALDLGMYQGKSLKGLPKIVNGHLWIMRYTGESLEGLPSVVNESLILSHYNGNDYNNLPKTYVEIVLNDGWYTKDQFDDFIKTERLKKALLD